MRYKKALFGIKKKQNIVKVLNDHYKQVDFNKVNQLQ